MIKGKFITFEGGEGAGKSTLIQALDEALKKKGYQTLRTREPGGSAFGEQVRSWLLNRNPQIAIGSKAELLLFLAARSQHLEEIILPALNSGKIILCDRFNDSTVAYQGAARGLGVSFVQQFCDLVCDGIVPDLTFLLDIEPEEGLKRTRHAFKENAASGELDCIEKEALAFHRLVRKTLLDLAKQSPDRIVILDASQPISSVFDKAFKKLLKSL